MTQTKPNKVFKHGGFTGHGLLGNYTLLFTDEYLVPKHIHAAMQEWIAANPLEIRDSLPIAEISAILNREQSPNKNIPTEE